MGDKIWKLGESNVYAIGPRNIDEASLTARLGNINLGAGKIEEVSNIPENHNGVISVKY